MAEYQIYRDANLREIVIGDTRALIRRDLNWEQKDKKGLTNAQRIQKGRAPLDENGISIELHHIGQHIDSPLAELTRDDHRGKGNDTILHDKSISSEAHGEGNAWDKERVGFWKERDVFNNFYREKFEPELIRIGQDRTSSVAERIKKIQELFSNAKYKRDINVPVDVQYVTGFHDDVSLSDLNNWHSTIDFIQENKIKIGGIKLTKEITQRMLANDKMVDSVIEEAHQNGYKVVAEGIETKSQLDKIKSYEFDSYQGYYFCRPVPLKELCTILEVYKNKLYREIS